MLSIIGTWMFLMIIALCFKNYRAHLKISEGVLYVNVTVYVKKRVVKKQLAWSIC